MTTMQVNCSIRNDGDEGHTVTIAITGCASEEEAQRIGEGMAQPTLAVLEKVLDVINVTPMDETTAEIMGRK